MFIGISWLSNRIALDKYPGNVFGIRGLRAMVSSFPGTPQFVVVGFLRFIRSEGQKYLQSKG
jgi:hypothetical protein